jgi:hypothetical protein
MLRERAILNGISHELNSCKGLINNFLNLSYKYTATLLPHDMAKGFWKSQSVPPSSGQKRQTRRERFERQWRKISWITIKMEDVEKLERDLHGHILALQLYEGFCHPDHRSRWRI